MPPLMRTLTRVIDSLQARLPSLRRRMLSEATARTILVRPVLRALGWNLHDPAEVQECFRTPDGNSVDFALRLAGRPVILLEARPPGDPLADSTILARLLTYAAGAKAPWCGLTTGLIWKVYRTAPPGDGPPALLAESSLDPQVPAPLTAAQAARRLLPLARAPLAGADLPAFTADLIADYAVRGALDQVLRDPPPAFLALLGEAAGRPLARAAVKASLARIWPDHSANPGAAALGPTPDPALASVLAGPGAAGSAAFGSDEVYHTCGRPPEIVALYRAVRDFCLGLGPEPVHRFCVSHWANFSTPAAVFCSLRLSGAHLRAYVRVRYAELSPAPAFARDISAAPRRCTGELELTLTDPAQLAEAYPLIERSYARAREDFAAL